VSSAPPATASDPFPEEASGPGRVAETRRRILEAAADCFTKYGFSRTRVDDVAAGAGVSRALVYDYFTSKKKLLAAVQRASLDDWFAASEEAVAHAASSRDALAAWLTFSLTESDPHALARAVFAADAVEATGAWDSWRQELRDEWRARLVRLMERGVAAGEFRADLDAEATALALRGLQVGLIQQILGDDPATGVATERQVRAAIALMLDGLVRAPRNP
jgi:AcrR family transcriptional regulator